MGSLELIDTLPVSIFGLGEVYRLAILVCLEGLDNVPSLSLSKIDGRFGGKKVVCILHLV